MPTDSAARPTRPISASPRAQRLVRWRCSPRWCVRAQPVRVPTWRSRRATLLRTSTGIASRVGRPTSSPPMWSPATPATTSSAASQALVVCGKAFAISSTLRPMATCCSWPASSRFGRTSVSAWAEKTCSTSIRAANMPITLAAISNYKKSCAASFSPAPRPNGCSLPPRTTPPSHPSIRRKQ